MNTCYSNLIEGNNTRPRDIERALAGATATDDNQRDLLQEAVAHYRAQQEIDRQAAAATLPDPADPDFIRQLHRDFYAGSPDCPSVLRDAYSKN